MTKFMLYNKMWVNGEEREPLPVLLALTEEQREAVKWAFKKWVRVAEVEGYSPIKDWDNFGAEVDHSSLLNLRLLRGKDAQEEKPPLKHSYPVYKEE